MNPGDKVIYFGDDNQSLIGKIGVVSSSYNSGRPYAYKFEGNFTVVPVKFDIYDSVYDAWWKNLRVFQKKKPDWSI